MKNSVHLIDCMEFMAGLPDNAYDLAIVDPPYGIGMDKAAHYYDSTKKAPATRGIRNIIKSWDTRPGDKYFTEILRVSSGQIIWGGNYFSEYLPTSRGWIGWDKKQPETSDFSMLEVAWSSFDRTIKMFRMYSTHVTQGTRIHPTQKPIALYKWLLQNYAKPGQTIFDSHVGSGSIRIACHDLGFDFTGCEIDEDYWTAQEARFKTHQAQERLFEPEEIRQPEQAELL